MFTPRRSLLGLRPGHLHHRQQSIPAPTTAQLVESWFFIDSVFPIRLARFDPRALVASVQETAALERLTRILHSVSVNQAQLVDLQPRIKDGGIYAKFRYRQSPDDSQALILAIRTAASSQRGLTSWLGGIGMRFPNVWLVKGEPWLEDMNRFASLVLKVEFEGSDLSVQSLWALLRPYGRIVDIQSPIPVPTGTMRYSLVTFARLQSAVVARCCSYGYSTVGTNGNSTRLVLSFVSPLKAHYIRDWIQSHTRIAVSIGVFLLGALTYIVFDPIREVAIQAKLESWFAWRDYRIVQWLKTNAMDRFSSGAPILDEGTASLWKEREEAGASIRNYLHDIPDTICFLHGPQGSGKMTTLRDILHQSGREVLYIDCKEIFKSGSDSGILATLAAQTGYWPMFTFLSSVNNMLDLASVGVIGRPAGLSTSFDTQIEQVLEIVKKGLQRTQSSAEAFQERAQKKKMVETEIAVQQSHRQEKILDGSWHDGRLDCVAGNGVISELGVGIETFQDDGQTLSGSNTLAAYSHTSANSTPNLSPLLRSQNDMHSVPVVVIRNFSTRNAPNRANVFDTLAAWAANLCKSKTAHVFVVSDNRENIRYVTKVLPTSPLVSVPFIDADSETALSYVQAKLPDHLPRGTILDQEKRLISLLGGRASDLDMLIHKLHNGESVDFAINDLISRAANELRKLAFNEDREESGNTVWQIEHAWTIVKALAVNDEIPYHKTLLAAPFNGNENILRSLEQADLISITIRDGDPTGIRPGRPIFKQAFKKLVDDPIFNSIQEINVAERELAAASKEIQTCEQELLLLKDLLHLERTWNPFASTPIGNRINYLLLKINEAETNRRASSRKVDQSKRTL